MVQLVSLAIADAIQRQRLGWHGLGGESESWVLAAAAAIPVIPTLSTTAVVIGWIAWIIGTELARGHMHEVVEAFGLTLRHEPWPLWAHRAASLPLLAALVMQLRVALWRRRIQKRVIGGELPFSDTSGTQPAFVPSPHTYFLATGLAAAVSWCCLALLVTCLVITGIWLAGSSSLRSAAAVVNRPWSASAAAAAGATSRSTAAVAAAAVAGGAVPQGMAAGGTETLATAPLSRTLGYPWWPGPGGGCPPTCLDLSVFKAYLGDDVCACNTIGGVFACHDHAGAASKCLAAAMAGLAVVLAGASWLLINTACQFSHTQCEALLLAHARSASAAAAAEGGQDGGAGQCPDAESGGSSLLELRAVQEVSQMLLRRFPIPGRPRQGTGWRRGQDGAAGAPAGVGGAGVPEQQEALLGNA